MKQTERAVPTIAQRIVNDIIPAVRDGKMVILVDDEDRENEGDLYVAASHATPEAISFMACEARGLVSLALTEDRLRELGLALITADEANTTKFRTAFATPIDAREGVGSGMSAHDRAHTIKVALDPASGPSDLIRPGRLQTLRAQTGGVLARAGHTEAAVDLARLAGLPPAGVICEIMNEDGTMARTPQLEAFSQQHGIPILRISDLAVWRRSQRQIRRKSQTVLPTRYFGEFELMVYTDELETSLYVVMKKGEVATEEPVLVRLHSQCLTGDVFGSTRCDCGEQLELAMQEIDREGRGAIVYMFDEGRGIGLANKILAYALQDQGYDTVEANHKLGFAADLRDYTVGARILFDLGVRRLKLMTNNPDKVRSAEEQGLIVTERRQLEVPPRPANRRYMETKQTKFGHLLSMVGEARDPEGTPGGQ
jgi:3,4-dihydroxy 2-butanone 4-phosphate synthase/GTP cyclohydrolase II